MTKRQLEGLTVDVDPDQPRPPYRGDVARRGGSLDLREVGVAAAALHQAADAW
ncbi:hypothetical protein [Nocardia sp. NPDC004711]